MLVDEIEQLLFPVRFSLMPGGGGDDGDDVLR